MNDPLSSALSVQCISGSSFCENGAFGSAPGFVRWKLLDGLGSRTSEIGALGTVSGLSRSQFLNILTHQIIDKCQQSYA